MAFVPPIAAHITASVPSAQANSQPATQGESHSRRAFLGLLCATTLVPLLPAQADDERLPPGAAHFNRVLSAQKQWASLSQILSPSHEITDSDWGNLRGYLRNVYAVSGDMDFLARKWDKPLQDKAQGLIKSFRAQVKGMDQPAKERNVEEFARMHGRVGGIFADFFGVFGEAAVADIPDEL